MKKAIGFCVFLGMIVSTSVAQTKVQTKNKAVISLKKEAQKIKEDEEKELLTDKKIISAKDKKEEEKEKKAEVKGGVVDKKIISAKDKKEEEKEKKVEVKGGVTDKKITLTKGKKEEGIENIKDKKSPLKEKFELDTKVKNADVKDKVALILGKDKEIIVQRDSVSADSTDVYANAKTRKYKQKVHASYYADRLNGRKTASGYRFDNSKYTAAHRELPFGTKIRVTNVVSKKSVVVTVNDRGPFTRGREIDLTRKAFQSISNGAGGHLTVDIVILTP